MGNLVYGDNDYDVLGQEKGAYFGRWGIIRRYGQEKGAYFGRWGIIRRYGQEKGAYFGRWGRN